MVAPVIVNNVNNDDLVGKTYVDPDDSGNLEMEVVAVCGYYPDRDVWVRPVGQVRMWWRSAASIRALVSKNSSVEPANA